MKKKFNLYLVFVFALLFKPLSVFAIDINDDNVIWSKFYRGMVVTPGTVISGIGSEHTQGKYLYYLKNGTSFLDSYNGTGSIDYTVLSSNNVKYWLIVDVLYDSEYEPYGLYFGELDLQNLVQPKDVVAGKDGLASFKVSASGNCPNYSYDWFVRKYEKFNPVLACESGRCSTSCNDILKEDNVDGTYDLFSNAAPGNPLMFNENLSSGSLISFHLDSVDPASKLRILSDSWGIMSAHNINSGGDYSFEVQYHDANIYFMSYSPITIRNLDVYKAVDTKISTGDVLKLSKSDNSAYFKDGNIFYAIVSDCDGYSYKTNFAQLKIVDNPTPSNPKTSSTEFIIVILVVLTLGSVFIFFKTKKILRT